MQTLTMTENGAEYFKLGCFNVIHTFDTANIVDRNYELASRGVINASNKVLSMAGGSALSFMDNAMDAEKQLLLSASQPAGASVGSPNRVGDSDVSYMEMEAIMGGIIGLHTYDANDVKASSVETTWDSLIDQVKNKLNKGAGVILKIVTPAPLLLLYTFRYKSAVYCNYASNSA